MHHRIRLELEINFPYRWHTGSGEGSFVTDRLIRRDSQNRPFIPASTLKGIIRQSCEKLSRTLGFLEPSDPHQPDLTQYQAFVPFQQMTSPVDQLFGTKFEPGGLFFRDARLSDGEDINTLARNRVARYRVLNTARDKHLFSSEYALPAKLITQIDGRHTNLVSYMDDYPPFAYCLLMAAVFAVERIGGDKSSGAGWLNDPITIARTDYNGLSVDTDLLFELLNPEDYLEMRGAL